MTQKDLSAPHSGPQELAAQEPAAPGPGQGAGAPGAAALREARLEAQHARKLALAILSTLQHRGILTDREVDSILLAAKRAAEASVPPAQAVRSSFGAPGAEANPASPPVFDIQVDE